LPVPDTRLHPNRLRQLASRGAQYAAQPLARFSAVQRYGLLAAYLPDLAANLTDQTLDMLDKILEELVRKGNKKQERHFQSNARAMNANLTVLTTAGDALLTARRDGLDLLMPSSTPLAARASWQRPSSRPRSSSVHSTWTRAI
jgi:hypothetical protein